MPKLPLHQRRWAVLIPYGALFLMVLVFFGDTLFLNRAVFWRDNFPKLFNWSPLTSSGLPAGEILPLWNPFRGNGKPLLADPESALLYPFNWMYYLLPPARALMVSMTMQLFLFGAGMYSLCRHWKLKVAPSLLAAICIMFGTLMIAAMDSREPFSAMIWGPLELLLMSCFIERWRAGEGSFIQKFWKQIHLVLILSCVIAIQYLAGFPQAMLNLLLLTGFFVLARCLWLRDGKTFCGASVAFGLAGALALCLTMVQILPTLEFIGESERSVAVDPGLAQASLHPRHLLAMLLPYLYGRPGYPQEYWAGSIFEFWGGTCYLGILPLLMLCAAPLVAWWKDAARPVIQPFLFWFFLGTGILSLLLAAGQYAPFYMAVYNWVPGFNHFRWPSKFLQLFIYSTAILSALGFDVLLEMKSREPKAAARVAKCLVFGWGALGVVASVGFLFLLGDTALLKWLTGGTYIDTLPHYNACVADYGWFLLFLALSLGLTALFLGKKFSFRWVCGLVIGFAFINLTIISSQVYPRTTDSVYESEADPAWFRNTGSDQLLIHSQYACIGQYLYGNSDPELANWAKVAAVSNLLQRDGMFQTYQDGLKLIRWMHLFSLLNQLRPELANRIADMMSVGYVVSGEDFGQIFWGGAPRTASVQKRPTCLPRAYFASQWWVINDPNMVIGKLLSRDFDPHTGAVIEPLAGGPPLAAEHTPEAQQQSPGSVHGPIRHTWSSAELNVDVAQRSLLVVTETWYPGWKVLVDGKPADIYRTNYNYRGVFVEPGAHQVTFIYRPERFIMGARISGITLLVVILVGLLRMRCASGKGRAQQG